MFPNIWTEILYWAIGIPFLVIAELIAMRLHNKWTGIYQTQKATLEMLGKLAKKRGYKRIAKQAIEAIKETAQPESVI